MASCATARCASRASRARHCVAAAVLAMALPLAVAAQPIALGGIEAYNRGDVAAAFRLLTAAAEAGDSGAQVNLGYLYARGQGTPANQQQAIRLYRLAADQGNGEAMNAIGFKYLTGSGVPADLAQAVHWLCRAALAGDPRGLNNLGILHYEGRGVPRDVEEFRSLWRQAADRGNPNAMFNLGRSLLLGPEQPLDRAEGERLIVAAGQRAHPTAQQLLRQAGYTGALPAPVNTELEMRVVPKALPPGRSRYCGALAS